MEQMVTCSLSSSKLINPTIRGLNVWPSILFSFEKREIDVFYKNLMHQRKTPFLYMLQKLKTLVMNITIINVILNPGLREKSLRALEKKLFLRFDFPINQPCLF